MMIFLLFHLIQLYQRTSTASLDTLTSSMTLTPLSEVTQAYLTKSVMDTITRNAIICLVLSHDSIFVNTDFSDYLLLWVNEIKD